MGETLELEREGAAKVIAAASTARGGRSMIDIVALKQSVASKFESPSILRKVMLAEPDRLPTEELIGKIGTWLAILREESG
jgi:hypothetical protein